MKTAQLKLNMKKSEFERVCGVQMKMQLIKHKDKAEDAYRKKLEAERLKLNKLKLKEFDDLMKENFELKKEISELHK